MTRKWLGYAIAAVCALSVAACTDVMNYNANDLRNPRDSTSGGTPSDSVSIVSFSLSSNTIWVGGTTCGPMSATASVTTSPAGRSVVFSSLQTNVATTSGNVVMGVNMGTATIRAAVSGTSVYQDKAITVMRCEVTNNGSLSYAPQNPAGTVGTTLQLAVTCTYSDCDPRFSSSNEGVISVNTTTGLLTFVAPSTAQICVIRSPAHPEVKFCSTGTSNPAGGGQHTYNVYPGDLTQNGCGKIVFSLRDENNNIITSGVAWSATASGMNTSTGEFTPSTPGDFTIFAHYDNHTYTTVVHITGTCGGGTSTASPSAISVANCTGYQATYPLKFYLDGQLQSGASWSWSSGSNLGSISGSTLTLNGTTGTGTITGTYNGKTVTIPVTVTQCQSAGIVVTVSPKTFALTVGQQPIVLNATVTGTSAGQSTGVTWSTSSPNCVALSPNGNIVTLSPIAGCVGQITVTATSVADQSKSDSATGTTSSGNIVCTITWNGTTTGTITLVRPNSSTATASCVNQYGAGFRPFGFSDLGELFGVLGSSGVETIDGVNYTVGPIFTLKPVAPGSGNFTVQADVRDKTVIASRPVTVQ